jgi:eukaryotic-like serine/threonine-protein kinase
MTEPIPYGPYLLQQRIAVGGMAEIWLGIRPEAPRRRMAVKRLLPTLADDRAFVTMFLDEARIGAQLDHPGIVPVQDLGRVGAGYYMAMEYVAGVDLRSLLARCRQLARPLPVALSCWIAARAAEALDHAHRGHGHDGRPLLVVHRDLSPANVLLGFDGRVRIIDFGVASAAFRVHREGTALRGKFGYLSPEQVRGLPADRRADVFSLGTVLHEMLAGERLFRGPSDLAVLERVRAAEVAPPSRHHPAVPPALDALVLRALAREPAERFPWASALAEALGPFAAGASAAQLASLLAEHFPEEAARERVWQAEAGSQAVP